MGDHASIVKAYDIGGVVPDHLDEGVAEAAAVRDEVLGVVRGTN